jgi:hypothetical protein
MRSFTLFMVSMFSAALACSSSGDEAPAPGTEGGTGGGGGEDAAAGAAGEDAAAGAGGEDAGEDVAAEAIGDVVSDATVCGLEDGASACDVCESASCCVEKTACYANAVCMTGDTSLDTCIEVADGGATGIAACYTTFAATGPEAQALVNCLRANCMTQCGVPAATE